MCHVSVCKPLWWEHVCPSRWTVMLLAQSFANGNMALCPLGGMCASPFLGAASIQQCVPQVAVMRWNVSWHFWPKLGSLFRGKKLAWTGKNPDVTLLQRPNERRYFIASLQPGRCRQCWGPCLRLIGKQTKP